MWIRCHIENVLNAFVSQNAILKLHRMSYHDHFMYLMTTIENDIANTLYFMLASHSVCDQTNIDKVFCSSNNFAYWARVHLKMA